MRVWHATWFPQINGMNHAEYHTRILPKAFPQINGMNHAEYHTRILPKAFPQINGMNAIEHSPPTEEESHQTTRQRPHAGHHLQRRSGDHELLWSYHQHHEPCPHRER